MNNIRKIINERLENARNHYNNTDLIIAPLLKSELRGEINTYQDCLNLIPAPRTEADILNDFEKLGWKVVDGYVNFTLRKQYVYENGLFECVWHCFITINKENKTYSAEQRSNWNTKGYNLSMQEHKLLNELFICWRCF